MALHTKVFEAMKGQYNTLSELAEAMGISVAQVSRVRSGKANPGQKFISGAFKAFPHRSFGELFFYAD